MQEMVELVNQIHIGIAKTNLNVLFGKLTCIVKYMKNLKTIKNPGLTLNLTLWLTRTTFEDAQKEGMRADFSI